MSPQFTVSLEKQFVIIFIIADLKTDNCFKGYLDQNSHA